MRGRCVSMLFMKFEVVIVNNFYLSIWSIIIFMFCSLFKIRLVLLENFYKIIYMFYVCEVNELF